jgi:hypothetical protein
MRPELPERKALPNNAGRRITYGMTEARKVWLEKVRDGDFTHRKGRARSDCRRLGWTEWGMERDGERRSFGEVLRELGSAEAAWREGWRYVGHEVLTPLGQHMLELAGDV